MRVGPLITSVAVAALLYGVTIERSTLKAFATGIDPTEEAQAATVEDAPPVSVVAMQSEEQTVERGLVLTGQTEAARHVVVKSETTGRVISDPLRKGATLTEGDTMCRLDMGTREASLAEARARLSEAEANDRASSQLAERGFAAETTAIARRASLEAAMAAVEQAETELDRVIIRAPFSGILESDTAETGELLQPGSACGTILALDPMKLVGFVPENAVGRVSVGSAAGARLVTGQTVTGEVTFLSRSADETTRTFRVEVEVPNPDLMIRDGVTAEIFIALAGEKAHLLPQSVLTLDDDGRLGVRAAVDGRARFYPVEVVRDSAEGVWLTGLPPSLDVIIVGQDFVRDGRLINITFEEASQ